MRLSVRGLGALLLAAVVIGASPGIDGRTVNAVVTQKALAVPAVQQIGNNWCWAASTQSILSYQFGISYSQCSQAGHLFSLTCSCTTPSAACDKSTTLGMVQYLIEWKKSIYSTQEGNDLSFSQFKSEINLGHPFWVRYGWGGSYTNGHIVVIRAHYQADGQAQQIGAMDPAKSPRDGRWPYYTWSYWTHNSVFTWSNTLWKARR